MCFPNILVKKNWYLNSAEQMPKDWNVDQLSVWITSWDITKWSNINLLCKELMERMSEHTGLISSYQPLITAACSNTGGQMKSSHSRAADRCPFVPRHSVSQITSFMQLGMLCRPQCAKMRYGGILHHTCESSTPQNVFQYIYKASNESGIRTYMLLISRVTQQKSTSPKW